MQIFHFDFSALVIINKFILFQLILFNIRKFVLVLKCFKFVNQHVPGISCSLY